MANTPQSGAAPAPPPTSKRYETLALIYQEALTVVERLRANRQRVADPETFRAQVRNALKSAEQDALRRGYSQEDVRVATFAVVAFLDESILNSHNPIFADWPRKPLQEELFGVHVAGEIFFRNVERLLSRQDSEPLADLLELYQLCLLLGFRGRYSISGAGEVRSISSQIEEKIRRIRGTTPGPVWQITTQALAPVGDSWVPVLGWTAVACFALALILFVFFKVSLTSSAGELRTIAAGVGL
jgi:type VI secretion system protein ImpK